MAQGYWQGTQYPKTLKKLPAAIIGITATPVTVLQFTLPPLAAGAIVMLHCMMIKPGATDAGYLTMSVGGTALFGGAMLAIKTNEKSGGLATGFRVTTGTTVTVVKVGNVNSPSNMYFGTTTNLGVASSYVVTVPDVSTPRELIVTAYSGGATDTVDVLHAWVEVL